MTGGEEKKETTRNQSSILYCKKEEGGKKKGGGGESRNVEAKTGDFCLGVRELKEKTGTFTFVSSFSLSLLHCLVYIFSPIPFKVSYLGGDANNRRNNELKRTIRFAKVTLKFSLTDMSSCCYRLFRLNIHHSFKSPE